MSDDDLAIAIAVGLCVRFEGVYLKPYYCPARVPTIGVGATYYENGVRVRMTDPPITKERAMQLLMWHVREVYMPAVKRLCPDLDRPDILGAITDFCLNVGKGNLQASTLRRRINQGQYDLAKVELMKWVRGGGVVLRGLVIRRKAECDIF
jgi:lysozyme